MGGFVDWKILSGLDSMHRERRVIFSISSTLFREAGGRQAASGPERRSSGAVRKWK
jgi:hypothetical protein